MTLALADPITDLVDSLGRRLPGGARSRRDVLDEVTDCLRSAQEAYLASGHDEMRAADLAVVDFGPVEDAAADYRAEVSAGAVRRTATVLAVGYPLMMAAWAVVSFVVPTPRQVAPHWITGSFTWISAAVVVIAAVVLLVVRRRARTSVPVGSLTVALPLVALVASVLTLTASLLTAVLGTSLDVGGAGSVLRATVEWTSGLFVFATWFSSFRCLRHRPT